jgi:hypothetical protein
MNKRTWLAIECVILFGGLPIGLTLLQLRGGFPFFPILLLFVAITLIITLRDPDLSLRPPSIPVALPQFCLRIAGVAAVLFIAAAVFTPDRFLYLPRERPGLWLLILLLYPLLSVAPQEFLYRTFFMQRYVPLFGHGIGMFWANALLFGWGHVFFLNPVAPVLSLLGGMLLTRTWQKTGSFTWVCIEHALYGQLVFTSGLGRWFHVGSIQAIQTMSGG